MNELEYLIEGKETFASQRKAHLQMDYWVGPPDLLLLRVATKGSFFSKPANLTLSMNIVGLIPKPYILASRVKAIAEQFQQKDKTFVKAEFHFYNCFDKKDFCVSICNNGKIQAWIEGDRGP